MTAAKFEPLIFSSQSQSQVKVTLRLTVSQSVCLGVEPKYGTFDQIFFFLCYSLVIFGAPSLTRGRVCHEYFRNERNVLLYREAAGKFALLLEHANESEQLYSNRPWFLSRQNLFTPSYRFQPPSGFGSTFDPVDKLSRI
jgi:hypothetical protein